MKQSKKLITTLGIGVGVSGVAALISASLAFSMHSSYKVKHEQTYYFMELKNQVLKTNNELKRFSITENNSNNDEIKSLFSEIDHANQLLANENSSIALMLEQRNMLKQHTPKALLTVAKNADDVKNLVTEYYSLVKDVDFQNIIDIAKVNLIKAIDSGVNKDSLLNNFYSAIDPLIEQQNNFSFGLETKIWTNHENLIKDNSSLFSSQEKSALISTIDQILSLLSQPQYSRDAIVEYEAVYDKIIEKLSSNKSDQNKNYNNFLENVIRVRNEINLINIDKSIKDNFLKRIDDYKNLAANPVPTLALDKASEISYLNDLVNNQLETLNKENSQLEKLLTTFSSYLVNLKKFSNNPTIQKLINNQLEIISKKPQNNPSDILNRISEVINLQTSAKNIQDWIKDIKKKINDYTLDKSISHSEATHFNQQLEKISNSDYQNINDYLHNLNKLSNNIYDNALLSEVFKNSLRKLNEQVGDSLKNGLNVNKNALSEMSLEINSLLNNAPSIKQLNDGLRTKSNQLREINRLELRNWVNLSASLIDKDSDISEDIKNNLKYLNSKASSLIPENSTAIREDLQYLIGEYRKEKQKANISDGLEKTYVKYGDTRAKIYQIFAPNQEKITSDFGNKLLNQSQELRKQAQIFSQNPNLKNQQKEDKFIEIQNQLSTIAANAEGFKELEEIVFQGDQALKSSENKKLEQAYLQQEEAAIRELKNSVFDALEHAGSSNNLEALKRELLEGIKTYKEKQAQYQSGQALVDNYKLINDTFAPYTINGNQTPTQIKILNELEKYRQQLSDKTLNNEQRSDINDKVANLMDVVESAKDLEITNKGLKALIHDTQNQAFGNFKPQDEYDKASSITNEVDAFLESLFTSVVTKKEIIAKIEQEKQQNTNLALAISVAFLKKTNQEILANKITDVNYNTINPYLEINNSIDSINVETQKMLNNTNKTQDQVDELENDIRKYLKLAVALKEYALKLQSINQNNNPIAYDLLLKVINNKPDSGAFKDEPNNTLIKFGESLSIVDFKTRILSEQTSKANILLEVENQIKEFEKVYTDDDKNRAIFDQAIANYNQKLSDYKARLGEFYASSFTLGELRDEIEASIKNEKSIRKQIEEAWNDAQSKKTAMQAQYNARKNNVQLTNFTYTEKVFIDFDSLVNHTDSSGKKDTLTIQLFNQLDKAPLGFAQDLFVKRSTEIINKINTMNSYSTEVSNLAHPDNIKSYLQKWVQAIKDKVISFTDPIKTLDIREDNYKLSAISLLFDQAKLILDYLDKDSKAHTSQKNYQVLQEQHILDNFLGEFNFVFNELANKTSEELYLKTTNSIVNSRDILNQKYFEILSFNEIKDEQLAQINGYKTVVSNKIDTHNNSIDSGLKTQILAKLDEITAITNSASTKLQLFNNERTLKTLQLREESLINLALKAYEASNLVNTNQAQAQEVGKQSILTSITNLHNSFKDSYLTLSSQDVLTKHTQLESKINLLNKFKEIYNLVNTKKTLVPMTYPDGTGNQGTATDAKTKMSNYFDALTAKLNDNAVDESIISQVESALKSVEKLINIQKAKIIIVNNVKNISDYKNFTYKNGNSYNYGFEEDSKKLSDTILKSVPEASKIASEIDNLLVPQLNGEFDNAYNLYVARKNALDLIYKEEQNKNGYKHKEITQLYQTGTNDVDSQYSELKDKADDFFHAEAQKISSATSVDDVNNYVNGVIEMDVFFGKFKTIASTIKQANDALNTIDATIESDPKVIESKNLLNEQITKGKSYYYTEKDFSNLDTNISDLEKYIARLNLAVNVAKAKNEVQNFNSNEGNVEFLSASAKTPLLNIINKPFEELQNNPDLESKENYQRLLESYINTDFRVAFVNSKALQLTIYKANLYLVSYETQINANANYEPQNIKDLYASLKTKLQQANNALNNINHNENDKLSLISEVYNSNDGALDLILHAESSKLETQYEKHLELEKYITGAYLVQNVSPKLADYEDVALNPIKNIDLSTPEKVVALNNALVNANSKYDEQTLAVYKWEANRYNSYKSKFTEYYDFLNAQNTSGIDKSVILQISGIKQSDLDDFNNVVNPQTSDTVHTQAKEYANKVSQNDTQLISWLKSVNSNEVVKTLSSVTKEFINFYQNLISIKSVPSILLNISNYQQINDELVDNNNITNVKSILNQIFQISQNLSNKITEFTSNFTNISTTVQSDLRNESDESNTSFASGTPTNITNARTEYFNKYKQAILNIAQTKDKLQLLIFGQNAQDLETLKEILHKYIEGATGYDGRANIENVLKYIASTAQIAPNLPASNDQFSVVKNEYEKIANPAIESERSLNNLTKDNASDFDIYSAITKGFNRALDLKNWMNFLNNKLLFFNYLTESTNGHLNYANVTAKESTQLEKFSQIIDNSTSLTEEDLNIDGITYKVKKINDFIHDDGSGEIGNLFDQFNILKGSDPIFNKDNVEVFVYKSSTDPNAKYLTSQFTVDPSIKRGYINLYFRFKKPTTINATNTAFDNIDNFGMKFENIGISFKTLDEFVISKSNIENISKLTQPLFTASEAGWNNLQAPVKLFGAFNKYSSLKASFTSKNYFTEDVDAPIDAVASGDTTSSPEFRIKVKFSGSYKGYTQVGNKIYWKTLNPYLSTDKGIRFLNTDAQVRGIIDRDDKNLYQWDNKWKYIYNPAKDADKKILFLPIIIGVPVQKTQANGQVEQAIMIISWQISNRFDKNPTTNVQNIVLGDDDKLRYVYFYNRTTAGKAANSPVVNLDQFYDYVMDKIRMRDFVGIRFKDLHFSNLWNTDIYIGEDGANQIKGGIGDADFYLALEKFDIKFKIH
ncbi:Uncharacterised protein [Mycoplasmopsis citelli]|uniref:Uncharacterized protein n=1 Tax=Mycoplasmopsis citelli TaxID=171281 RepID=A0A449B0W1_9BACT|nr:hypothetical protein [Mycoplasmopsis citelli]VEU74194.1 Uncharacterised protein [Mycoplasmopsis citelli]